MKKRIISLALAIITLLGMLAIPASAASPKVSVTTGKYVTIKNVGTGKYLNVYGSRSTNNTNITVYQADGTSGQYFSARVICLRPAAPAVAPSMSMAIEQLLVLTFACGANPTRTPRPS